VQPYPVKTYEKMDIIPLTAPYIRADTPADHPSNGVRNCVFVRLTTGDGRLGWGEAYSGCYATEVTVAALRRMERSLLACETDDPFETMRTVRFRNLYWAMRGIGAVASSAIEAAVFDVYAQAQGKPLWQLLNNGKGQKVLAYASAGDNSFSPEGIFKQARRLREAGYRAYKIRAGGKPTDSPAERLVVDTERIAAGREAMGPEAKIFVDVGVPQRTDAWPRERAEAYLRALEPYRVGFLEEPAKTYDLARYVALQKRRSGGVYAVL
jgi:D-galactarolactone cycloisomerase